MHTTSLFREQKVLVQEFAGDIFAVSNKCSHLGLPLQARPSRALLSSESCSPAVLPAASRRQPTAR